MNKTEINEFIEKMSEVGDVWEEEEVKRVYNDYSLQDALDDRLESISMFANIIETVINR